jgi:hypothetical protein
MLSCGIFQHAVYVTEGAINVVAKTKKIKSEFSIYSMKTTIQIHKDITRTALGIALAGMILLSNSALAQEKGASVLMRLNHPQSSRVSGPAAPKTVPMSCPKCLDVVKQVPNWDAKGAQILMAGGRPTKPVVQHQCDGCATTIAVIGHGKSAKDVVQHKCTACGAEIKSCCNTAEKGKPTPGM